MNESLAQEPSAAHRGALVQKRGLARNIQGGLVPAERAEVAFIIDSPLPIGAKLPQDVGQAISPVADTPQVDVRKPWNRTLKSLME